jgi:hypothetical protein
VQRQFGVVLRLTVAVVMGIELLGNRTQWTALGHWLRGEPRAVSWDLCAGLAQSDVLAVMVAIAIAIPALAIAIAQLPRPAHPGDDRPDPDEQGDRIAAFRLMAGLARAIAAFAALGAALACLQVGAVLLADTAWGGSCTVSGGSYVVIVLAIVGVLLAGLVVLPISGQLEAQRFLRRAEQQRLERQLGRLRERAPRQRGLAWHLVLAVVALAVATAGSVLVLAWLVRPGAPLLATTLELVPLAAPGILVSAMFSAILAAIPAYATWWAVSLDLSSLARGLALLGWLAGLMPVGMVIAGSQAMATSDAVGFWPFALVLMLPAALAMLWILGIARLGWGSGGVALVLVRRVLQSKLAEARSDAEPEPAARRGQEPRGQDRPVAPAVPLPRRALPPDPTDGAYLG